MRYKPIFIIFCISVCLATVSCSHKKTSTKNHLVFRYNEHKNISSLDPAFSKDIADIWATHQLFNGLVQMDSALNPIPSIAKDWSIVNNGLVYTFTLRDDVYFHKHYLFGKDSTRQVVASDFTYSFDRLTDKSLASPGSWVMENVANYSALNDSIFEITLKQPFPAFLGLLSMKYCSVVPKEVVEHYGSSFRANPIGTGPFKFKRWEENIKLVLRRNPNYFEVDNNQTKLPYLESVAITFLPDKQSEFLQFAQGNIDFVSGLDGSYKDEILTATGELRDRYKSSVTMQRAPYLNTEYLGFFLESDVPELQSKLIRRAINYAFDRKKMMLYLRNGIGIPAEGGFIPKGLPGYSSDIGYNYDPFKAKALIEQYILETGNTDPSITITTTSNYLSFCEFIQRQLEQIGLNVAIDVIPASSLKDAKANGKADLFRASWVADYPDAENYLSLYYSTNFAPSGPNYTHYQSDLYDKWYSQTFTITDPKERTKMYSKMDSLVMDDAAIVPLFYDEVVRFTQKNVTGLGINPINLLELKRVKKLK
ncbi:MAG: ABC transporter substrate-binding protein [Winogradskyella sp.]|nr:ABC transporter substrate-binding protein [Winogradskyella sp.]